MITTLILFAMFLAYGACVAEVQPKYGRAVVEAIYWLVITPIGWFLIMEVNEWRALWNW